MRENLSEEELVVFDILTRPAPDLSDDERAELKKVTREMLARLKSLLVLDWRSRRQAIARVRSAIEDALSVGLPEKYPTDLYNQKVSAVFEHVYEKYPQAGASVYAS